MLSKSLSKDRNRKVTPPGPVYMNNDQFASYLSDLRNNRVARPSGARPPPPSNRREFQRGTASPAPTEPAPESPEPETAPRSSSAFSHRRAQSSLSSYSSINSRSGRQQVQFPAASPTTAKPLKASDVVPTSTYMERGLRWMEKEEAVSLREAMEDLDLKKQEEEEARLHAAAQDEASELVFQHQNPEAAVNPDAPFRYKDHLRKNSYQQARAQSLGRAGGLSIVTGLARDMARTVPGEPSSSGGMRSPPGRISCDSTDRFQRNRNASPDTAVRGSLDSSAGGSRKPFGSLSSMSRPQGSRRKPSGKRNISGELSVFFTGDQIWEEPEQEGSDRGRSSEVRDMPAPLRIKPRNPLNRVQFDMGPRSSSTPPEPTKRLSISEIHRNPPSQSRNPNYTANPVPTGQTPSSKPVDEGRAPAVPMKDGLEIRGEDIRQATSMRLKDRSPKLPTPTAVSNKPGRPIKCEEDRHLIEEPPIPDDPPVQVKRANTVPVPVINLPDSTPSVPTINLPDAKPSIPTINFPDSTPSVPTISLPDASAISVSAPDIPQINVGSAPSTTQSKRPLPTPKPSAGRPAPHHAASAPPAIPRGHWSPAAGFTGRRATATCHQCQLPIEGKVVKLGGSAEHFHPECFICFTCGTGLESLEIHPEPKAKCAERLDRIRRRARGEEVPEVEGQTMAEDGDERLRFYCHLDFHENFAPRCKHCTTTIIGEHLVALGHSWHYGHFFCAECGDPFEKGMTHIEKDGYAWCLSCQTKRTERQAPKCKKCNLAVIGEYVQALGGEWHEKCFRCATCQSGFDDGAFYPLKVGEGTAVLCLRCIERELKA
ncbi:uncharacterized protein L3040_002931 [Drepanopeziza brunnea f. sp. 'multigermtubi']|uniref:uncharacterized protein n=1 Tax=Drepanopeziza brunnea f. sp. 'multigermtubi' TaxID=698441 RepID=UPI00239880EF|nr:hypothetical protein L3040_002931 [Drepanopeziza brunnea f. sp. 'multigermtubi']